MEAGSGAVLRSPRYNIAPSDQVPILTVAETGHRQITPMVWGFSRSGSGWRVGQINARAETVSERGTGCAVITDRFYMWTGAKGAQRQMLKIMPDERGPWRGHR